MKKIAIIVGMLFLGGFASCHSQRDDVALMSRDFLAQGWERFDFITNTLEVSKPTTLNLCMKASFDPSYAFDFFSVVFTVFDEEGHPLRAKSYKFNLKDPDGSWKADFTDGCYTFMLPINQEMSLNEPGKYLLQLENRMPITPLAGIRHVSIVSK